MKKSILCLMTLFLFCPHVYGETAGTKNKFPDIFHDFGDNLAGSVTYNYGLNFLGATIGTWIIIETGYDWKWRNTVFDSKWMQDAGSIAMPLGNIVPIITPLIFYAYGKSTGDERAVTAAEALTQAFIMTTAIQTPLKMITGRREPGVIDRASFLDDNLHKRIYGEDDFSNEWDWFSMDFVKGWPSGHTANAFAASATLSEIYHDNIWVKVGAYTYATLLGLGTTANSHWLSEAFSGALIGYAIGKTVGKSYRKLLEGSEEEDQASVCPYLSGSSAGIVVSVPI